MGGGRRGENIERPTSNIEGKTIRVDSHPFAVPPSSEAEESVTAARAGAALPALDPTSNIERPTSDIEHRIHISVMSHPGENIYLELTRHFNQGKTRTIISSGQAVVLHRLAIMSKDGDWIVSENTEDLQYVLNALDQRGARYRFGAPLDARWLAGGWSSHFEFASDGIRVRCDFFSRPPRITDKELALVWENHSSQAIPYLDIEPLLKVKLTQREKDYAVIGELARKLPSERQLIYGRSARDLITSASENPEAVRRLEMERPLLRLALLGDREALEEALDKERRLLMRNDENRLAAYTEAAREWQAQWPSLHASLEGIRLNDAHLKILQAAEGVLPFAT
jgi:hypothetical protein